MLQSKKLTYISSLIYLVPLFLLVLLNTFLSFFQTTYMDTLQMNEIPLYKEDRFYLILLFYVVFVGILFLIYKKTALFQNHGKLLHIISLVFSAVVCIAVLFIYKAGVCCDSGILCDLAKSFLKGDYSSFTGDAYLVHYPHQVGMIAFLEILFSLFGVENYLAFQLLNLLSILFIIHFLYRISAIIYENTTISSITSMLSMGALPLFMFVTFVYGDIPGLAFALGAITLLLRYLKENQRSLLILCFLCMGLAMLLKSNNTIVLIAIIISLVLHAIQQRKWKFCLDAALFFVFASLISSIPALYYKQVCNIVPFPTGIPKIAWVAMGLQANEEVGDGWYNAYNWNIYSENNHDTAQTEAACLASIQESINHYISEPKQGAYFFYTKFRSQWNDPGYQSQITNEWSSRHQDSYTSFYNWLVFGTGKKVLEWIMNLYQFLILSCTLIAIPTLMNSKKWNLSKVILPLCIFGGYLFHMFWEAQGRYALPYFIMMIPLAASGILTILSFICRKTDKPQLPS